MSTRSMHQPNPNPRPLYLRDGRSRRAIVTDPRAILQSATQSTSLRLRLLPLSHPPPPSPAIGPPGGARFRLAAMLRVTARASIVACSPRPSTAYSPTSPGTTASVSLSSPDSRATAAASPEAHADHPSSSSDAPPPTLDAPRPHPQCSRWTTSRSGPACGSG